MAIIKGNSKNNILEGGADNDSIFGLGGDDILFGMGGNDRLDGGPGIDKLSGGAGNDTYVIDNKSDTVLELAGAGIDTVRSSVNFTLAANVENLVLTGTAALDGTGNALANTMTANSAANTLIGKAGDDTLDGNSGVDALAGGSGNDLLMIKNFNNDIIDGGLGDKDVLQITGPHQRIDLTAADTSITGIETIKFSGSGNNVLTLSSQSVLDLSSDSDTLIVDGDAGDTVYLDAGWKDGGAKEGYHTFTQQGATVNINTGITDIVHVYTLSNAATAAQVGNFFSPGIEKIVIDFGEKGYNQTDLSGRVIDLSGFGLEDTLAIAVHDGFANNEHHVAYHTASVSRYKYINQSSHRGDGISFIISGTDRVSWQKASSTARLVSHGRRVSFGGPTYRYNGTIQIVGLPAGLPDSQFIFV